MNNIEILEELINDYRNCGLDDFPESVVDFELNKSQIIAIKNLIQENKDLNKQLNDIHSNFCKFNWKESNGKQVYNQLVKLYESIYRKEK